MGIKYTVNHGDCEKALRSLKKQSHIEGRSVKKEYFEKQSDKKRRERNNIKRKLSRISKLRLNPSKVQGRR